MCLEDHFGEGGQSGVMGSKINENDQSKSVSTSIIWTTLLSRISWRPSTVLIETIPVDKWWTNSPHFIFRFLSLHTVLSKTLQIWLRSLTCRVVADCESDEGTNYSAGGWFNICAVQRPHRKVCTRAWHSCVLLVARSCPTLRDPQTAACQAPLSMWFSRQGCWSR